MEKTRKNEKNMNENGGAAGSASISFHIRSNISNIPLRSQILDEHSIHTDVQSSKVKYGISVLNLRLFSS